MTIPSSFLSPKEPNTESSDVDAQQSPLCTSSIVDNPTTSFGSDNVAQLDIADAMQLRLLDKLTFEEKIRFMSSTLKVGKHFKFPFVQGKSQKFYLSSAHFEGDNDCFYYSPKLEGVLCL